jgi:hypothetical protein
MGATGQSSVDGRKVRYLGGFFILNKGKLHESSVPTQLTTSPWSTSGRSAIHGSARSHRNATPGRSRAGSKRGSRGCRADDPGKMHRFGRLLVLAAVAHPKMAQQPQGQCLGRGNALVPWSWQMTRGHSGQSQATQPAFATLPSSEVLSTGP